MRRAPLLLVTLAVSGCAAAPEPEPEPPVTPVIDLDEPADGATKADKDGEANQAARDKAAAIAKALAEIDVKILGTLGSDGATVADVLAGGDVPAGLLDVQGGVTTANSSGLTLSGSARVGGGGRRIATAGPRTAAVQGPKGTVSVSATVTKGKVANAASVVARMRGRFRRCYQHRLNSDPSIAGTVTLGASIGPNGDVLSVGGATKTSLKAIVPCLKAVIASDLFAPPDGGSALVSVVVTFAVQTP
jgi:hypothetical protein